MSTIAFCVRLSKADHPLSAIGASEFLVWWKRTSSRAGEGCTAPAPFPFLRLDRVISRRVILKQISGKRRLFLLRRSARARLSCSTFRCEKAEAASQRKAGQCSSRLV